MLRNPLVAVPSIFWHETEVAGRNLGVTLQPPELRGPEDFEAAIAAALAHDISRKAFAASNRCDCSSSSPIFDIRYFSERRYSYLDDDSVTAYGRRLAWYLNSQGISLGAYHGKIEIKPHKGGDELWWLRHAHVGIAPNFSNVDDANEIAMRGTVVVLRILLPNANAIIERADIIVRQYA